MYGSLDVDLQWLFCLPQTSPGGRSAGSAAPAPPTFQQDHVTLNRCQAKNDRIAGYLLKNEQPASLLLASCSDERSACGLVIEYDGTGLIAQQFVSTV